MKDLIKLKLFIIYAIIMDKLEKTYSYFNYLYFLTYIKFYCNRILIKNQDIIYTFKENDNLNSENFFDLHIYNKKLYFKNNYLDDFIPSKYKFTLINIHSNNKKYDITKLIQNNYNFMVKNNILFDKNFFILINKFYFKNKLSINDYKFCLIDKDINFIELTKNEHLIINNDNYKIIKNNN